MNVKICHLLLYMYCEPRSSSTITTQYISVLRYIYVHIYIDVMTVMRCSTVVVKYCRFGVSKRYGTDVYIFSVPCSKTSKKNPCIRVIFCRWEPKYTNQNGLNCTMYNFPTIITGHVFDCITKSYCIIPFCSVFNRKKILISGI
jgi:hypothetical protein